MDIAEPDAVRAMMQEFQPWAIVNTAGFVRVAHAAGERSRCMRENATGPAVLAEIAANYDIPLVTFSSDLVFNGLAERPYFESDPTSPMCVYGESKAEAERHVMASHPHSLVVRTSAFFGPWDRYNFVAAVIAALRRGELFSAASNQVVSPTYVPDLVHCVLDLLIDEAEGIWHVVSSGSLSWHEFACRVARAADLGSGLIRDVPSSMPRRTALQSERGIRLPLLVPAIERCARELAAG